MQKNTKAIALFRLNAMFLQKCWLSHFHNAIVPKKIQHHTVTVLAQDGFLSQRS